MTKTQIIQAIQKREAIAYLEYNQAIDEFGDTSLVTSRRKTKWAEIHELMQELNIDPDHTLPEAREVYKLIVARVELAAKDNV